MITRAKKKTLSCFNRKCNIKLHKRNAIISLSYQLRWLSLCNKLNTYLTRLQKIHKWCDIDYPMVNDIFRHIMLSLCFLQNIASKNKIERSLIWCTSQYTQFHPINFTFKARPDKIWYASISEGSPDEKYKTILGRECS